MAGKNKGNEEFQALLDNDELDTEKIAAQIKGVDDNKKPDEKKPDEKKPDAKPDEKKPEEEKKPDVPNPDTIRSGILNEMFGDHFKTVEDVKKANIPASLKERETLRQRVQDLETQLKQKPKHAFVSDDFAKMNEFVRETGIKDPGIFNKLNVADVANMVDMDALILQHTIDNPRLAMRTPQELREYFEMKYRVDASKIDPKKVESGDLTQEQLEENRREYNYNKLELESDAEKAKSKLIDLKAKIKMPKVEEEIPATKKWTPEIEAKQKEDWGIVNEKMVAEFSKIPITIKGGKEPIVNFALPEEASKAVLKNAMDYIVSNQMEVNQANVTSVANAMYSDILMNNREEIYHAIFERARSMTEKEYLEKYSNPSKSKNTDTPEGGGGKSTEEEQADKAFELENKR